MRHDPIDPGAGPADERPAFPAAGLRVIDCMSRPVLTIGWQEPLAHAWALMEQRSIRHLPVLDAEGALLARYS